MGSKIMMKYLFVLILLASCSQSNTTVNGNGTPGPSNVNAAEVYSGTGFYSTVGGGQGAVTGTWTRFEDKSGAKFEVTSGRPDVIWLDSIAGRWKLDARDARASTGDANAFQSADSLIIIVIDSQTNTQYYLKRQ
jgi:hypothetical protein